MRKKPELKGEFRPMLAFKNDLKVGAPSVAEGDPEKRTT
jgi:hypothetical protein